MQKILDTKKHHYKDDLHLLYKFSHVAWAKILAMSALTSGDSIGITIQRFQVRCLAKQNKKCDKKLLASKKYHEIQKL